MSRTITIKAITNAYAFTDKIHTHIRRWCGRCVLAASWAHYIRKQSTQTLAQSPCIRAVQSEFREGAKPIFISYSYLPLERREQGLLHIHAPQMWIKWWWGCNNIPGSLASIAVAMAHAQIFPNASCPSSAHTHTPNFNASCFGSRGGRTPSSPPDPPSAQNN